MNTRAFTIFTLAHKTIKGLVMNISELLLLFVMKQEMGEEREINKMMERKVKVL